MLRPLCRLTLQFQQKVNARPFKNSVVVGTREESDVFVRRRATAPYYEEYLPLWQGAPPHPTPYSSSFSGTCLWLSFNSDTCAVELGVCTYARTYGGCSCGPHNAKRTNPHATWKSFRTPPTHTTTIPLYHKSHLFPPHLLKETTAVHNHGRLRCAALLPAYPMSSNSSRHCSSSTRSAPEWNAVEVLRAGPNPRWKCKSCNTNYTGAPRRIAQHILGVGCALRERGGGGLNFRQPRCVRLAVDYVGAFRLKKICRLFSSREIRRWPVNTPRCVLRL